MASGLITALLVAVRVGATCWGNVVQKRLLTRGGLPPLRLFAAVWGWMTLLSLPWWITAGELSGSFWWWISLTCLLEVPGNVLLLRSLQHTELSIFGPLSSIKPVVSLLLAFLMFGEQPNAMGLCGVAVVLLGTLWLTSGPQREKGTVSKAYRRRGVRDRLLAVLLTAIASVFLKQALVGQSEAQVLAVWCMLSWLLAILWQVAHALYMRWSADRRTMAENTSHAALPSNRPMFETTDAPQHLPMNRQQRRAIFMVAAAMLVMQACTISLFARMPVGYALALFQIGSLVNVVVGHRLFGEGHLLRRLLAAGMMVAGAAVIIAAQL